MEFGYNIAHLVNLMFQREESGIDGFGWGPANAVDFWQNVEFVEAFISASKNR